jgi:integrase
MRAGPRRQHQTPTAKSSSAASTGTSRWAWSAPPSKNSPTGSAGTAGPRRPDAPTTSTSARCSPGPATRATPSSTTTRPRPSPGRRSTARHPGPTTDQETAAVLGGTRGFWYVAALLGAYEGARACEVASIRKEDITEESVIFEGKGGKVAAVPTHELVWRAVRDFPGGPIARHMLGREVPANYISGMFPKRVRCDVGLTGINFHRLRHWFATTLLNSGADLRTVQELMRHSSPNQTMVYTQITDRQRRTAIHALPAFAPTPS